MPVPPAELTATFSIDGPDEARAAAFDAARGMAREGGPEELLVAGPREEVLAALGDAVVAALDAGAHGLDVKLESRR